MDYLQKKTTNFSRSLASSKIAFVSLLLAAVALIALLMVFYNRKTEQSDKSFYETLSQNATVSNVAVTLLGTVEQIKNTKVTIQNGKDTFSFTADSQTIVSESAPTAGNSVAVPKLSPFSPDKLHIGDHIQVSIVVTNTATPVTRLITIMNANNSPSSNSSPSSLNTSNGVPPPPAPPTKQRSVQSIQK